MLDYVKTRWVMMLDADERLVSAQHKQFEELCNYPDTVGGIYSYNTGVTFAGGNSEHYHVRQVRIFRNRPEIKYFGAAHETVNQEIEKLRLEIVDSDLIIYHVGYCTPNPEVLKQKCLRNIYLMLEHFEEYKAYKEYLPHYLKTLKRELSIIDEVEITN
jgi:hypothetical protein